jgi:ubiquinone/menaquinone biosynthesis C-methylase UbiE
LVRQGWEEVASEYALDRLGIFGRSGRRLLKLVRPVPGGKLLDVGTGTGAVALQARAWIGSEGLVMGSDWISPMLALRP